ncbi:hypothetical protein ACLOJK_016374 [Asimina triloba]
MLDVLDDEDCIEEPCQIGEKKRRLNIEQVKALEKSFEVENKLEPERKVTLARELGLQPRQVAIWFQNRRARWKTKQLERDYNLLKADHEALKLKFDTLRRENEALAAEVNNYFLLLFEESWNSNWLNEWSHSVVLLLQIEGLKSPLEEKKVGVVCCDTKEEIIHSDPEYRGAVSEQSKMTNEFDQGQEHREDGLSIFRDSRDGPSDSDSSAILNEENAPRGSISPERFHPQELPMPSILRFDSGFPAHCSMNYLQFSDFSRASSNPQKAYQQMMKMEELDLVNGSDGPCNLFGEEQALSIPWYCSEPWN